LRPALALCIGLPLLGLGLRQIAWTAPQGQAFTVALLQGDVPQSLKWDPQHLELSLRVYAELAQAHPAQLTVLPETAIPLLLDQIPTAYLRALAGTDGHLLLGAAVRTGNDGYANGAVLLNREVPAGAYFKRHLVPFGEFVPAGFRWFLDLMRIPMSDFSAGSSAQPPLAFAGQQLAPNICYEDLFGEELIQDLPQASLLVNLSNTAWFGHSLAQPQHLQIAQMRAMETGRMILRATNTGMTAAVAPDGSVVAALQPFTRDALTVTAQGYAGATPYVRYGNAGVFALLILVFGLAWRRRTKPD
ncbi:MAG TPA: apolipoprotein N-acyltransferase, partial [Rhodocyclaceae bacterium]|nr:apolipoprotein N-acyltransferase [Rhodocyclaceae bacterium]